VSALTDSDFGSNEHRVDGSELNSRNEAASDPEIVAIVVGDVQGCSAEYAALHDITVRETTKIFLAGDLVNRGPASLNVLQAVAASSKSRTVLGNHDFFLLACAVGARRAGKSDTIGAVLAATEAPLLLNWLRRQPLAIFESGHLLVHAGLDPRWSVHDALRLAGEVQTVLQAPGWEEFLRELWVTSQYAFAKA
jgi:bis(5'-nucleosyl)-tetraphosphatase (symmetrical)